MRTCLHPVRRTHEPRHPNSLPSFGFSSGSRLSLNGPHAFVVCVATRMFGLNRCLRQLKSGSFYLYTIRQPSLPKSEAQLDEGRIALTSWEPPAARSTSLKSKAATLRRRTCAKQNSHVCRLPGCQQSGADFVNSTGMRCHCLVKIRQQKQLDFSCELGGT